MNSKEVSIIKLLDFGSSLGTRDLGRKIREHSLFLIQKQKRIMFDFHGVHLISSAFADEIFGKIFLDLGEAEFRENIRINGFDNNEDKNLILLIIQKAIDFRKSKNISVTSTQPHAAQQFNCSLRLGIARTE